MEELRIVPTRNTPEVILSPEGQVVIKGRSISENASDFFAPVDKWITTYVKSPAKVTRVDLNLEYFNSASAKILIQILQKVTLIALKNKKAIFNWYYEEGDDDILERGQFFASVLSVDFNFVKITPTL
jgi:hypothetical protein